MNLETKKASGNPNLGILLVGLGALALMSQVGLFRGLGNVMGALLFGVGGLYLVRSHYRRKGEVWALCVGYALLGLGAAAITGPLSGTAFLGLSGAGFLIAYRDDRRRWWAVIPGGVLVTLALIAGIDRYASPIASGPLFFLGLAAIFWYLYRNPGSGRSWAVYPAAALTVVALLSLSFAGGWLLPVALIAAGIYFLNREQDGSFDAREVVRGMGQTVEKMFSAGDRNGRAGAQPEQEVAARSEEEQAVSQAEGPLTTASGATAEEPRPPEARQA